MNLEGIRRVMELEAENERLRDGAGGGPATQAARAEADAERRSRRDLVPLRQAVAVFGQQFPHPPPPDDTPDHPRVCCTRGFPEGLPRS